jgi:hypothetical protein
MSLKEELANRAPQRSSGRYPKGRCGVNEWLKTKDDALVADFKELLDDETSTMEMHRFLRDKFPDLSFSLTTFRSHRNHWCSCR